MTSTIKATSRVVEKRQCPNCAGKGRDTAGDNLAVYDDGHEYCFACGFYKGKNGELDLDNNFTYEYLPWREVNKSSFQFYDCLTKISPDGTPLSIGYKYPNGSYKIRRLDQKQFHTSGDISSAGLFGRDKFEAGCAKSVTITEGELDALSLYQVLGSPVVSVQSASSAMRDCSLERSWLNSFERVYLAFDNDKPGRDAVASVAKLFDYNKVFDVRFSKHKDANDYLCAGDVDALRTAWWNSKRYLPENIISDLGTFKEILKEKPEYGIPYPWKQLTDMTYGIRTGETVLITAQEGIGKTEIMHAIEHKLLKESDLSVGAIFLEEPKLRHLQALAGLELECPAHLPDSGCTEAQIADAIQKVVQRDDRLHIYDHYGSDDPELLLDTIRFLVTSRSCRIILLDHITMVVSGGSGKDERRDLDAIMTKLEMMVKELDFALIVVSHVNDIGQTRGSRYISKIAHTRIDVDRDINHPDDRIKNTTTVTISKNRYGRKTGLACKLYFNLDTNSYEELFDEQAPANSNNILEAMVG